MSTTYSTRTLINTDYSTRTPVNTSYFTTRLAGAYLIDNLGRFITDNLWRRIIILSPNGNISLSFTTYTTRTLPI